MATAKKPTRGSLQLTPSRISPASSPDAMSSPDDGLTLNGLKPPAKLVLDWPEARGREGARLQLKSASKILLQWPLEALDRIDIFGCSAGCGEPRLRFELAATVEHLNKVDGRAPAVIQQAVTDGSLRAGTKVVYLTYRRDAMELYQQLSALRQSGQMPNCKLSCDSEPTPAACPTLANLTGCASAGCASAEELPLSRRLQLEASHADGPSGDGPSGTVSLGSTAGSGRTNLRTLVFACSPAPPFAPLKEALQEASRVNNILARAGEACLTKHGGRADDLHRELIDGRGCFQTLLFCGHGDVPTTDAEDGMACTALGFTDMKTGQLAPIPPATFGSLLGRHGLNLVVLNACSTLEHARLVHAAGVPFVVCWATRCHTAAAQALSESLFESRARGRSVEASFADAVDTLLSSTSVAFSPSLRHTAEGPDLGTRLPLATCVSTYSLSDPDRPRHLTTGWSAKGEPIPDDRGSATRPSTHPRLKGGYKLPLLAGVPVLLTPDGAEIWGERCALGGVVTRVPPRAPPFISYAAYPARQPLFISHAAAADRLAQNLSDSMVID